MEDTYMDSIGSPPKDEQGYLLPYPDQEIQTSNEKHSQPGRECCQDNKEVGNMSTNSNIGQEGKLEKNSGRSAVKSIYQDLWDLQNGKAVVAGDDEYANKYFPLTPKNPSQDDPIYDEVDTLIPSHMCGAKIIPIEQPPSAYDEVIVNDGRYVIPSSSWESDSDAPESDFDDEMVPNYFGDNLEELYESVETRRVASPTPRTVNSTILLDGGEVLRKSKSSASSKAFVGCLPFPRNLKNNKPISDDEDAPIYVDPNKSGVTQPVMPPISLDLSTEEVARYEIVNKILDSEAVYIQQLNQLLQIKEDVRDRGLLDVEKLDVIFCSIQDILQCHEVLSIALAGRMNEWTVSDKLGDIICASFSKATTLMAYTEFVTNFSSGIDTYRAACKTNVVFAQYLKAKENNSKPKISFHGLMLRPLERCVEFITLIQDLLEVTPVHHPDRVPLQLSLTHLECLAEAINIRRRETEMKHEVKYLDSHIGQLNKPLSSSGRLFIRQDDVVHCLIDGMSVVGTKKLRLVLLSDMLLCLSPANKKKNIVSGLLNNVKYKYKLKWNVPLSDVQLIEYGAGVSVDAGKYGTVTTYSDQGLYRQATNDVRKHIEDLQHDLAVIGQIAGLASSLRGKHELIDQQKVEKWYKSVENKINEELRTINMFWLEISLPTRSGQQNYVFNLQSPTVKEEWESATRAAKLALETRNNPGWYLPDDDLTGGLSILRRNMPLLDEFFDLFNFNSKSRVEQTLTYPVDVTSQTALAARGLGHYVWISARGELQGHVTVLRFERNSSVPRFVESFSVCPGTVYCMARIPRMNTRDDQQPDKYHTKYGFPFPTIWLGSHSSRIYIFDASSDDRSRALMEIKLRDAPLAMKFTKKKIYVGLANGTLAIFRSNTSEHWNLVQPSILPLGRYPVAVITDVKDKLWCGSGSQIYIVCKKGDRIQRIIAVDPNMKNLVKHIVSCSVGVWVSVWRKATIKSYHAETFEMMQEVNVMSPVMKMKNDVDSQVQYLAIDKVTVTALLIIPGFLWVGTSIGLILIYPIPKLQGVPRVIGRACVAFHAHCGPVRSLFAVPDDPVPETTTASDDAGDIPDENAKEIDREFSMLADSDESVGSDEEFFFVDDAKTTSPEKKSSGLRAGKFKITLRKSKSGDVKSETGTEQRLDIPDIDEIKVNDFATMMETFSGFTNDENSTTINDKDIDDENDVKYYRNRLYVAAHSKKDPSDKPESSIAGDIVLNDALPGANTSGENTTSEKKTLDENVDHSVNSTEGDSVGTEEKVGDNIVVTDEVPAVVESPEAELVEGSETGNNLLSDVNTQTEGDNSSPANENVVPDTQPGENQLTNEEKVPKREELNSEELNSEVLNSETSNPHAIHSSENSAKSAKVEPIYVNLPPIYEDILPINVSQKTASGETRTIGDNANGSQESRVSESNVESSKTKSATRNAQELYIPVLPDNEKDSNALKESTEIGGETLLGQLSQRPQHSISYSVVSAGEGHVDLRMKLKSKSEVKKDTQTRLFIWRLSSKV